MLENYPQALLEHARKLDVLEFIDFETYMSTPEPEREHLSGNIIAHYRKVNSLLDKMLSYGENQWWISTGNTISKELQQKIRVYFQVFDCGLDILLINVAQLANDLNDLLGPRKIVVTTWMLRQHQRFFGVNGMYRSTLLSILMDDTELEKYLEELQNGDDKKIPQV